MVGNHLLPEVKTLLDLTNEERIFHIEKDNWIGYSRARLALSKLKDLYTHPQRQRMPNLLMIGHTNNGKSMIVEKFRRDYPPIKKKTKLLNKFLEEKEELIELPILNIQMLPVPDLRKFYKSIFDQIYMAGGYENSLLRSAPVEEEVVGVFRHFNIKMLIIDEIHNILSGRNDKQHEFLNGLRYLGNSLKIPIICVGTKDAYLAIRSDAQLENRFEPFLLPLWKSGQEYESLLASIMSVLPLKYASNLNQPLLSSYILEKTEGILGEIFTLLRRAAVLAIISNVEKITHKVLKQVDYHSPSERI